MNKSNPLVCAIMLADGRKEMTERAIRCFGKQTYPNKRLLIWDNEQPRQTHYELVDMLSVCYVEGEKKTIGEMRNDAIEYTLKVSPSADVFVHWDSDDWSHPWRIQEQVALMEMTGHECVGYRDLLFWRSVQLSEKDVYGEGGSNEPCDVAEDAWYWSNHDSRCPIGTSLCYARRAWERVKFLAAPNNSGATSEYYNWLKQVNVFGVSSIPDYHGEAVQRPRMIASIHGANSALYDPAEYVAEKRGTSWRRAEQWDNFCRETMAL